MKYRYKDLAIIIPAYNEEKTIEFLIKEIHSIAKIFVIDDGSTDKTYEICFNNDIEVIKHKKNLGYDLSIKTGLKKAHIDGFRYAITIDADGQHDPKYIDEFYSGLKLGSTMVVGNRDSFARIGEVLFGKVTELLFNVRDPLCGLKAYSIFELYPFLYLSSSWSVGTDVLIRAGAHNFSIESIPINVLPRKDESRFGIGVMPNIKILNSIIFSCILYFKIYLDRKLSLNV
jgi:glycosyltransferase involved in cell wall biosynthesis